MSDRLSEMWEMQKELNARIGVEPKEFSQEQVVHWTMNFLHALNQEGSELLDSMPWKWWSNHQTMDMQNAKVEVVDMWHFLMSLAQVLGMTEDEFFSIYQQKHKKNHERQDSGYKEKTDDCRDIS